MSTATTDPTLETLVPNGSAWRNAAHDAQLNAAPFAVPVTGGGGPPCGW